MPSVSFERCSKRHERRGCSSLSSRPAPRARSMPLSPRSVELACRSASRRRRSVLEQPARAARGAGIAPCRSGDLCVARIRRFRRPDQLWSKPHCCLSPGRHLRGKDPQGRQARRSAGPAADEIRAGHQPQDRQGARPHRAAIDARCAPTRLSSKSGERPLWGRIRAPAKLARRRLKRGVFCSSVDLQAGSCEKPTRTKAMPAPGPPTPTKSTAVRRGTKC